MHVPLLLTDFLDRAVRLYGKKKAIIDGERSFTYEEMQRRVHQLANGLRSLSIGKGDKIAYLAPNSAEMLEGFYGVFHVGGVMTSLNTRLRPEDYVFILNHSESKVLFVAEELYPLIEGIRSQLQTVTQIYIQAQTQEHEGTDCYETWLSSFSEEFTDREPLEEADYCSLLYTSGTTGNPKGVLLSHRSNYLHALSTMHHLNVRDHDVLLHVLPMFHVNGWGSPFYYTANGATQVMQRKVDPESMLRNVKEYGVTVMHMAPTVLNMVLEEAAHQGFRSEQHVRVVIAGSAPPAAFVRKVEEGLGWTFIQVYGMTEISPLITLSEVRDGVAVENKDARYRLKAKAGYEMIGSKVRVVNEYGEEVAHDGREIGEIVTRSNNVMEGYFKNPEATAATVRDGWLYTGDMATVDGNGYVEIVDRKKDVIISGGENISSIEVEGALYEHEGVLEAAVIAVPHEKWGEVPHAIVVLRAGVVLSEEDVLDFVGTRLARFKVPKGVTFVEGLPKTASGKIQKVVLRDRFWGDGKRVN